MLQLTPASMIHAGAQVEIPSHLVFSQRENASVDRVCLDGEFCAPLLRPKKDNRSKGSRFVFPSENMHLASVYLIRVPPRLLYTNIPRGHTEVITESRLLRTNYPANRPVPSQSQSSSPGSLERAGLPADSPARTHRSLYPDLRRH